METLLRTNPTQVVTAKTTVKEKSIPTIPKSFFTGALGKSLSSYPTNARVLHIYFLNMPYEQAGLIKETSTLVSFIALSTTAT